MPALIATPRRYLLVLLLCDLAFAVALWRVPRRLVLPATLATVPNRAPEFAAVAPGAALFITAGGPSTPGATISVVPLAAGVPAASHRIDVDVVLRGASPGLDAFVPAGPRWAWNGRVLAFAAPTRGLGSHRIAVLVVDEHGALSQPQFVEGSRPAIGWARERFEFTYVTSAPGGAAGRVQWLAEMNERGAIANQRIVASGSQIESAIAWPSGIRTPVAGVIGNDAILPNGSVEAMPRESGTRVSPLFALRADGATSVSWARSRVIAGSEISGDFTVRAWDGTDSIEAHVGARVARPHYALRSRDAHAEFETDREANALSLTVLERDGVVHVLDARGFHSRHRAGDLEPLDARMPRIGYVAGALGGAEFALVIAALALAHALAIVVQRGSRGGSSASRFAQLAGMCATLLAGGAALAIWNLA